MSNRIYRRGLWTLHEKDLFRSLYQPALKEQVNRIYPSHRVHFNDGLKLGMAKHHTKSAFTIFLVPLSIMGLMAAYCCHGDSRKKWRYSIFHDAKEKRENKLSKKYIANENETEDEILILFDGIMENEYVLPWWDFVKSFDMPLHENLKSTDKLTQENVEESDSDITVEVDIYESKNTENYDETFDAET